MTKFILIEYNRHSKLLLNMTFIQFCYMGASPYNVSVIKVRVNIWDGDIWSESCFSRYNNPIVFDILFDIVRIWILHDIFSSSITSKNFTELILSNISLLIFSSGKFRSMALLNVFWKNVYLSLFLNFSWITIC